MKILTKNDLETFQDAIQKDYGIKLEGNELYTAAYNLLKLFETFIQYDKKDKEVRKTS